LQIPPLLLLDEAALLLQPLWVVTSAATLKSGNSFGVAYNLPGALVMLTPLLVAHNHYKTLFKNSVVNFG
jgi:hypothetical protein